VRCPVLASCDRRAVLVHLWGWIMSYSSMPFGKYRGVPLRDIPLEYLGWLLTIDLRPALEESVRSEIERRTVRYEAPSYIYARCLPKGVRVSDVLALIDAGRRSLAKRHHPDVAGGDTETMQTINRAADFLLDALPGLLKDGP
jgi:hypothetical protein